MVFLEYASGNASYQIHSHILSMTFTYMLLNNKVQKLEKYFSLKDPASSCLLRKDYCLKFPLFAVKFSCWQTRNMEPHVLPQPYWIRSPLWQGLLGYLYLPVKSKGYLAKAFTWLKQSAYKSHTPPNPVLLYIYIIWEMTGWKEILRYIFKNSLFIQNSNLTKCLIFYPTTLSVIHMLTLLLFF